MAGYRIISSDSHVFEPPNLWTSRIEPKYRDRAPRIVRMEDGGDWWVCEGEKLIDAGAGGAQAGRRFEEPENLSRTDQFENIRPGGYIPEEHVKDMDVDGVDAGIIYPTAGTNAYRVLDGELLTAIYRTYNDWLAEFCSPFPDRLRGIAMLNTDDVGVGVRELERCAAMGLAGAAISVYPVEERGYFSPEYETLWAAAQDLEMPLSLHLVTNRPGSAEALEALHAAGSRPAYSANVDHWVRMSLGHMILSGVFERYPKLTVGSVEMELSWAPHFLDRLDYTYTQRAQQHDWYRFKEDMLPSDYFQRNVFLGFQQDDLGVQLRHIIGVDSLAWGSDYPHNESTFPRSRQILDEILADCTEEEKAKIVGGNTARIYHLD